MFNKNRDISAPSRVYAVTPGDDLSAGGNPPRFLFIGSAGHVKAVGVNDPDETGTVFKNLPAGYVLEGYWKKVLSSGTTATDIVAMGD